MLTPAPTPLTLPGPWEAVVFDMDGLLVHTERQWLQAKQELFRRYGQELTAADRAAVFGFSDVQSATYFAGRLGLPDEDVEALRVEYLDIVGALIDAGIELTDGATLVLERVRGQVPIALASNTRRALVERILSQTPFGDWFDAIATGDEVPPKPAPDVYRLACERIGADPATTVAVEDSPAGITAARAAGLHTIGVPSDAAHPLSEADHQVTSLAELL
ncbi:MAG: HAD family phosphatase [Candidatus Limnocylindrales bacterium]